MSHKSCPDCCENYFSCTCKPNPAEPKGFIPAPRALKDAAREILKSKLSPEPSARDIKIYLHPLPLGGFIRAVDEKDYLELQTAFERLQRGNAALEQQRGDWIRHEQSQYDGHVATDKKRKELKAALEATEAECKNIGEAFDLKRKAYGILRESCLQFQKARDQARAELNELEQEIIKQRMLFDATRAELAEALKHSPNNYVHKKLHEQLLTAMEERAKIAEQELKCAREQY